jgi:guanylate kinase
MRMTTNEERENLARLGSLIVISGPSGVGKGTICKKLLQINPEIFLSVSATTRKARREDAEGVTYFFKTPSEFKMMIERGELLEWTEYGGNFYGTPLSNVTENLARGRDVLLEIETAGAQNAMKIFPDGIFIFIMPPNIEALELRLIGRGENDEAEIARRLEIARGEMTLKNRYNYVVTNENADEAASEIDYILHCEKLKKLKMWGTRNDD